MAFELPTNKQVVRVDIATFAGLLMGSRHRFITLVWQSEQSNRFYQTQRRCDTCGHVFFGRAAACPVKGCGGKGVQEPTQIKGASIERVYVAGCRNDFNFANSVRNHLERNGEAEAAAAWEGPKERAWGEHVPHTPFVAHAPADDGLCRLYGHFLPGTRRDGSRSYFNVPGFTGYYVNGVKAPNDKALEAYKRPRQAPKDATEAARLEQHPVNARLDGTCFAKIAGQWYLVKAATPAQIEKLAAAAMDYAAKVEAEVAAAVA